MSDFVYPKSVTSGGEPRISDMEAVQAGVAAAESEGLPITTGSIREFIAMPAGRIQQILYYLGYRALEGTVKPYGRGHTWVWHKPKQDSSDPEWLSEQQRRNTEAVFGTATGKVTGYDEWRTIDPDINGEFIFVRDITAAYEAIGLEVRIQIRSNA